MKTLKIALFSAAVTLAPAAYAQVVNPPVETEQPAPETAPDIEATDTRAPETTDTDTATPDAPNAPDAPTAPETPEPEDAYSKPMAR